MVSMVDDKLVMHLTGNREGVKDIGIGNYIGKDVDNKSDVVVVDKEQE